MSDDDLIIQERGSGASKDITVKPISGGTALDVINKPIRDIQPIVILASACRSELDAEYDCKPEDRPPLPVRHVRFLARLVEAKAGYNRLRDIRLGESAGVEPAQAMGMVAVLNAVFASPKQNADVSGSALSQQVCAELFNPDMNGIGVDLKLWKDVPRDPAVVALAMQYLFHAQIFKPTACEIAAACRKAARHLDSRRWDLQCYLIRVARVDCEMYWDDPRGWQLAHNEAGPGVGEALIGVCANGEHDEAAEERYQALRERDFDLLSASEKTVAKRRRELDRRWKEMEQARVREHMELRRKAGEQVRSRRKAYEQIESRVKTQLKTDKFGRKNQ